MGMVVTKTDDELCVELDTSTATDHGYIPYITDSNDLPKNVRFDIRALQT